MLEQPPEKSEWEIRAEAAAAAEQAIPPRQIHGCLIMLIWCMPTPIFWSTLFGVGYLSRTFGVSEGSILILPSLFLIMAMVYGVGLFDGVASINHGNSSADQRRRDILFHAARFTAWQILYIPAISFALIFAIVVVNSLFRDL